MGIIRWIAKKIYHSLGWKLVGTYPFDIDKKIVIVAPHTSSTDFWIGILVKIWLDIRVAWYAKKELFTWPISSIIKSIGAKPVDRSKNNRLVDQIVNDFKTLERHTILIAPEGTRKKVERFKSGFYQVAKQTQAAVIPIIFDFGKKEIRILNPQVVSPDGNPSIEFFENLYRGIEGKVPANSFGRQPINS